MKLEKLKYFESLSLKGNQLKDVIQTDAINVWLRDYKGVANIVAFTGFGKTEIAKKIINRFKLKFTDQIIIVVPDTNLYNAWTKTLEDLDYPNWKVYIINTYTMSNNDNIIKDCKLLFVDELHHATGKHSQYFNTVLDITNYEYFLGLSATLDLDQIAFLKNRNIETAYEITINDGIRLELIPPFEIINFGMEFTDEQKEEYYQLDRLFAKYHKYFLDISKQSAFDIAMACSIKLDLYHQITIYSNEYNEKGEKKPPRLFEGTGHDLLYFINNITGDDPKTISKKANLWREVMTKRKDYIHNTDIKFNTALAILKKTKLKTISFCPYIPFVTKLYNELKATSVNYHSKLSDVKRKGLLKAYEDGVFQHLITVKALDEGLSIDEIELGLNISYSSKDRQTIQRTGRILRLSKKNPNKRPVMINLYHSSYYWGEELDNGEQFEVNPIDLKNLLNLQENMNVSWVTDLEQLNI